MAEREIVEFEIQPSDAGSRVDRILRKLLPGVPLSRINRMLRRGEVTRAGRKVKGSDRAGAGDCLTLALGPDDAAELRARLSGERTSAPEKSALALPVLYEDEHVIALDKPAGIASHPGSAHPLGKTVLGALRRIAGEGTATFRPSLVGRLDRDTSGVQLAGKSPEGLRGLEALSRAHEIRKTYLALVRGEELPNSGCIDLSLRDRGSGRARMEVVEVGAEGGIAAVTEYRVLARGRAGSLAASLVEVEPRTGRRHQIRAHFAHLGAPLAGDVRYGDRAWNAELRSRAGLRRLFLHCASVSFPHPLTGLRSGTGGAGRQERPGPPGKLPGAETTISSPLPRGLSAVLTKLGIRIAPGPNP